MTKKATKGPGKRGRPRKVYHVTGRAAANERDTQGEGRGARSAGSGEGPSQDPEGESLEAELEHLHIAASLYSRRAAEVSPIDDDDTDNNNGKAPFVSARRDHKSDNWGHVKTTPTFDVYQWLEEQVRRLL